MIEAFIVEKCIVDGKPLDESEVYKFHLWLWGEERCRLLVEEEIVPVNHPPPDEVMQHGRLNRTNVKDNRPAS